MAKVLMFHRVLPDKLISQPNAYSSFGTLISLEYFEHVIKLLKSESYEFVTISQLVKNENNEKLVALTFDDGYADNFEYAMPLLQKNNITATFFPVIEPCKENSVLPLDIYYQCVDELITNDEARADYIKGETKKKFYYLEPLAQMQFLNELFSGLPSQSRVSYMSGYQLKFLSDNGFEIGSHGITHSLLTADYMNDLKASIEMKQSKLWLETILDREVTSYCFPSGKYNNNMVELAKRAGYKSICLISKNKNHTNSLPCFERVFVKQNSLDELKLELKRK